MKESGFMGKGIIRAVTMLGFVSEEEKWEASYWGVHCVHNLMHTC